MLETLARADDLNMAPLYRGRTGKQVCIQGESDKSYLYRDKSYTKDVLFNDGQGKDLKTNFCLTMHKRVAK